MADEQITTALATRRDDGNGELTRPEQFLMPAVPIQAMVARYNAVVEFARLLMKPGMDYGVIPGTGGGGNNADGAPNNKKNTLLKPGAEKLCTLFGLVAEYEDYRVVEDWTGGFFNYGFRCLLKRGDRIVGTGIGSCNSREKKYRRTAKVCPDCGQPTIFRSKKPPDDGGEPGWYCWTKKGGCGAQFAADNPTISSGAEVANPDDACDLVNTILKMGQKRAFVAAVLQATNASEFFTQDLEEVETIDAEWQPTEPPQRPAAPAQPKAQPNPANPDGTPNLAHDETFFNEAKKAAMGRGITPAEFEAGLASTLAMMKTTLAGLPRDGRRAIISGIQAGRSDKWKSGHVEPAAAPAPAPAPTSTLPQQPAPAAEPVDLETEIAGLTPDAYKAKLRAMATEHRIPRQDFDPGIQRFVMAKVGSGKTLADLSTADRIELLEAVAGNALDYGTGQLQQVAVGQ